MTTYRISSKKSGQDMGLWEADSAPEALVLMHRAAGYRCSYDEEYDKIIFRDECSLASDGSNSAGQVGDWDIEQVERARGFTWVTDDATWGDEVLCDEDRRGLCSRAEVFLAKHEGPALDITVRPARDGELAGVYEDKPDGSLQILGGSYEVPQAVQELTSRAWEHALRTWGE